MGKVKLNRCPTGSVSLTLKSFEMFSDLGDTGGEGHITFPVSKERSRLEVALNTAMASYS